MSYRTRDEVNKPSSPQDFLQHVAEAAASDLKELRPKVLINVGVKDQYYYHIVRVFFSCMIINYQENLPSAVPSHFIRLLNSLLCLQQQQVVDFVMKLINPTRRYS